jgi:membrane-associated phospholipid phosphatase
VANRPGWPPRGHGFDHPSAYRLHTTGSRATAWQNAVTPASRFPPVVLIPVLLGLALFVALAVGQALSGVGWLDQPVHAWLRGQRSDSLSRTVRLVTRLGDGWLLTAVTFGGAALLYRRSLSSANYLLGAGLGVALMSPLFKWLLQRPRPDALLRLERAGDYSFPSGHALASTAVYGAIAIVVAVRFPRARIPVTVLCGLLALAIGLSRVYLHVHYLSDVLAGWALGAAWAVALGRLMLGPAPSRPERPGE